MDVIVVTYNSAKTIIRCPESIRAAADLTVTVVDNDSQDPTRSLVPTAIHNASNAGSPPP